MTVFERVVPRSEAVRIDGRLLVLGGMTREGSRLARQLAVAAAEAGHRVVWLDGFEDRDVSGRRVPLPFDVVPDHAVEIVEVAEPVAQRLEETRVARLASTLRRFEPAGRGPLSRRCGPLAARFARLLTKLLQLRRGTALWWYVRDELLSNGVEPAAVAYTDETTFAAAWELSRRAPQLWVDPELPPPTVRDVVT